MNAVLAWLGQGSVVALAGMAAVRLIPRTYASTRYLFWWAVLALTLALPLWPQSVVTDPDRWLPRQRLSYSNATVSARDPIGTAAAAPGAAADQHTAGPGAPLPMDAPARPQPRDAQRAALFLVPAPVALVGTAAAVAWLGLAAVLLIRLGAGLLALRRFAAEGRPLDPALEARMPLWCASRFTWRTASLRQSDAIDGACAIGFFRPRILISSRLAATLSPEALEAVVLHEQAHLWRYDDWTRLLQQLLLACAWLHPAVAWISRQIDRERESACDRHVVERLGTSTLYARALADVAATGLTPSWRVAAAPAALRTRAALRARVERLFDARRISPGRLWTHAAAGLGSVSVVAVSVAVLPPLVALAAPRPEAWRPVIAAAAVGVAPSPERSGSFDMEPGLRAERDARTIAPPNRARPEPSGAQSVTPEPFAATPVTARRVAAAAAGQEAVPGAGSLPVQSLDVGPAAEPSASSPDSAVAGTRGAATEQLDATTAASPGRSAVTSVDAALPSTAVVMPPLSLAGEGPAPSGDRERGAASPFIDAGNGVARAGVATGDAAARTGSAIGRFFGKGGASIARKVAAAAPGGN